jgi:hypothetical protein
MKNLIILMVSLIFFFSQTAESKISEAIANTYYQECLQSTKEVVGKNKSITNEMIENYCICNVNELDKLVDDKGYVELMLKYHQNPNHKSREFDIILGACKKYLN